MKYLIRKFLSCTLILSLCTSITTFASTTIPNSNTKSINVITLQKEFDSMTIKELNQFIDSIANKNNYRHNNNLIAPNALNPITAIAELKLAWLAAAQIAKLKGYSCSAKLIECSVAGTPYKETNSSSGLFRNKIKKSNVYISYIKPIKRNKKTSSSSSFAFTKSDNSDLFYSLHNVNIATKGYNLNTTRGYHSVGITDVFDFAFTNNYDSPFTSFVNNWAWLCQNTRVLNKINVTISFNEN